MTKRHIDIDPIDLKRIHNILNQIFPMNVKVWVFGSRATGKTKRSSDLDLVFDANRPLSRQEEFALADAFDASDLAYKVDVVDWHAISQNFQNVIIHDMKELDRLTDAQLI